MSSGWLDGYGSPPPPAPPSPQPQTPILGWKPGQRRRLVEAICCAGCGSFAMHRRDEYGMTAYWKCDDCGQRQKEPLTAGGTRAHII